MKLTYWYAQNLSDSNSYSIRTKTLTQCKAERAGQEEDFAPPVKVTVEYRDGFHLMKQISGEGGNIDEAIAASKASE